MKITEKDLMNNLNSMTDVLIEQEFRGLNAIECLLKIFKENKKAREKEHEDN